MFEIPVGDLLASYDGDSKELAFNGDIYDGYYEDIIFTKPLEMNLKIIGIDDGVNVVIELLSTAVKYKDTLRFINVSNIEREFKKQFDLANPDDIKYISRSSMIDLKEVIREEILIQCID